MSLSGDRLARTRLAIIEHIQVSRHGHAAPQADDLPPDPAAQAAAAHGRWAGLRAAGREYWAHHPARMATQLATPVVSAYARRHPIRLLAVSAAAGALLVLARPWKLISVTGLALAALRSPQLSSMVLSALTAGGPDGHQDPEIPQPARSTR